MKKTSLTGGNDHYLPSVIEDTSRKFHSLEDAVEIAPRPKQRPSLSVSTNDKQVSSYASKFEAMEYIAYLDTDKELAKGLDEANANEEHTKGEEVKRRNNQEEDKITDLLKVIANILLFLKSNPLILD